MQRPVTDYSLHIARRRMTPAPQPLWIYKREPAGMGEWCYRIYRNNHYMLYAESESIAMIICNGLNRDEQATHTTPPAPEELHCDKCRFVKECSLLYFPPCERLARQDEQHYRAAAKAAREQVLESIHKRTFQMRHRASSEEVNNEAVVLDYSAVYELLQSLRAQQVQPKEQQIFEAYPK